MKTSPFSNHPAVNWKMPSGYKGILTPEEYECMLALSLEQVSRKAKIVSAALGKITAIMPEDEEEDDQIEIPLNSLFLKCKDADQSQWQDMIAWHLRKLPIDQLRTDFLKKDLSHAKKHLRILIEPEESVKNFVNKCITRKDFPGTYTCLALDSDDFLHFVYRDEIEWEASDEKLFQIALDNVTREKMLVQPMNLGKSFTYYGFFSSNFSAAFMIELERNAGFALGAFGAVVTIPITEATFVCPINDIRVMNFPTAVNPLIDGMWDVGQLTINKTLYWYYKGKYEAFPVRMEKGKPFISFPMRLMDLLVKLS